MRDYYSRYVELMRLSSGLRSADVVKLMKIAFARHGVPIEVLSDNGPQFIGQSFKDFKRDYNFEWNSSSPGYQQSNGMAESAVKVGKRILRQDDPEKALMIYNATPIAATGYSPAQLLMGRKIRTNIPQNAHFTEPKWPDFEEVNHNHNRNRAQAELAYNKAHGAHPLPPLSPGDKVRVMHPQAKQWSQNTALVVGPAGDNPRSYLVDTPTGPLRRNRRHLLHIPNTPTSPMLDSDTTPIEDKSSDETPPACVSQPAAQAPPTTVSQPAVQTSSRSSCRVRQPPAYLKDYET